MENAAGHSKRPYHYHNDDRLHQRFNGTVFLSSGDAPRFALASYILLPFRVNVKVHPKTGHEDPEGE